MSKHIIINRQGHNFMNEEKINVDNKNGKFYTLALVKKPQLFPIIGNLVGVPQSVIKKHLDEIEQSRDDEAKSQKILNRFLTQQNIFNTLFHTTEFEKEFKCDSLVPLEIIDYNYATKSQPMTAVCSLRMFSFPDDINDSMKSIELPINYLVPVEPLLCNTEYVISYDAPDNITTFGEYIEDKGYYKIYKAADVSTKDLVPLLKDLGLKEYSRIIKFDPVKDLLKMPDDHQFEDDEDDNISFDDVDTNDPLVHGQEFIDMVKTNPLYKYSKRLYIGFVETFRDAGVTLPPEVIHELYFMIFDTMLRSNISATTKITLSKDDEDSINQIPD